jgi:hypothetical protein
LVAALAPAQRVNASLTLAAASEFAFLFSDTPGLLLSLHFADAAVEAGAGAAGLPITWAALHNSESLPSQWFVLKPSTTGASCRAGNSSSNAACEFRLEMLNAGPSAVNASLRGFKGAMLAVGQRADSWGSPLQQQCFGVEAHGSDTPVRLLVGWPSESPRFALSAFDERAPLELLASQVDGDSDLDLVVDATRVHGPLSDTLRTLLVLCAALAQGRPGGAARRFAVLSQANAAEESDDLSWLGPLIIGAFPLLVGLAIAGFVVHRMRLRNRVTVNSRAEPPHQQQLELASLLNAQLQSLHNEEQPDSRAPGLAQTLTTFATPNTAAASASASASASPHSAAAVSPHLGSRAPDERSSAQRNAVLLPHSFWRGPGQYLRAALHI